MKAAALPPIALLLALAACDSGTPESEPPDTATPTAPVPGTAPAPGPDPAPPAASGDIPAAIQGRWGMAPADCEPGRSDAKGLLVIGPNRLEFYESVGVLGDVAERSASSIRAIYDFTGEGMSWQRDQQLELRDGGDTLVRREYGQDAAPEPLHYDRCA